MSTNRHALSRSESHSVDVLSLEDWTLSGGTIMIVSMMNCAKVSVVIPAAVSSLWLVSPAKSFMSGRADGTGAASAEQAVEASFDVPVPTSLDARMENPGADELTVVRRTRIENILAVLNRVAEVSMQMEPERAAQLEPVILDLAEQAMALSQREVVVKASTAKDLDQIEKVVRRLSHAVANSIEPEMQL